jgi:hypothetical protein
MQALIYTDMLRFFYETIKTIVLTLSPFVLDFLKSILYSFFLNKDTYIKTKRITRKIYLFGYMP